MIGFQRGALVSLFFYNILMLASAEPVLMLTSPSATQGQAVSLDMHLTDNTQFVGGFNAKVLLPPGVTCADVLPGALLPGDFQLTYDTFSAGAVNTITLFGYCPISPILGNGVLAVLSLEVSPTAPVGTFDVSFATSSALSGVQSNHAIADATGSVSLVHGTLNGSITIMEGPAEGEGEGEGEGEELIHPADLNTDWHLVMSEAIAYLSGWQQGSNPIAYAIRAAYLWQNGEYYIFYALSTPPLCWVLPTPAKGEIKGGNENSAIHSVSGTVAFIDITPPTGTSAWGAEVQIPEGLTVLGVAVKGPHGVWDTGSRSLSWWGLGAAPETLSYEVNGPDGTYVISGEASFDGTLQSITGNKTFVIGSSEVMVEVGPIVGEGEDEGDGEIAADEGEGESDCEIMRTQLEAEWPVMATDLGLNDNAPAVGSGKIPERWVLESVLAVACKPEQSHHNSMMAVYAANLNALEAEGQAIVARIQPYEHALAAILLINRNRCDYFSALLGLQNDYKVAHGPSKDLTESFSEEGDLEFDGLNNLMEYQIVLLRRGSMYDYAEYVLNPNPFTGKGLPLVVWPVTLILLVLGAAAIRKRR